MAYFAPDGFLFEGADQLEAKQRPDGLLRVFGPEDTGGLGPISASGTNISIASHSGVEALVDLGDLISVSDHSGDEALLDLGDLTSIGDHAGDEALVDLGDLSSFAIHTQDEALLDLGDLTSFADHSGAEALADLADLISIADHAGDEALAEVSDLISIAVLEGIFVLGPRGPRPYPNPVLVDTLLDHARTRSGVVLRVVQVERGITVKEQITTVDVSKEAGLVVRSPGPQSVVTVGRVVRRRKPSGRQSVITVSDPVRTREVT